MSPITIRDMAIRFINGVAYDTAAAPVSYNLGGGCAAPAGCAAAAPSCGAVAPAFGAYQSSPR